MINYLLFLVNQMFQFFCLLHFMTQPLITKDMSQEEAIKIIQLVERTRQGRLRAKLNEASRNMNRMYRIKDPGTVGTELAAVCIQKVFSCQHNTACLFFLIFVIFHSERFS